MCTCGLNRRIDLLIHCELVFSPSSEGTKDQSGPTLFAFIHHLIAHGNSPYPFLEDTIVVSDDVNRAVMESTPHTSHEDDRASSVGSLEVNLNDTVADHLNELNGSSIGGSIDFDVPEPDDGTGDVNWDMDTDGLNIVIEDGGGQLIGWFFDPSSNQSIDRLTA